MLCPGGFEHAGGIGRWAGYLFQAWPNVQDAPPLCLVDTRGFGGVGTAAAAYVSALARLARLYWRGQIGLIHLNLSVRGSTVRKCLVSLLAGWCGVPVVVHLHSGRFPEFYRGLPGWGQKLVRGIFARADRVLVLGEVWKDLLATDLNVPRSKIVVLFNAVAENPDAERHAAAARNGTCHIVMLGRMGPPKGLPELMQALGSEAMRGLDWRVTLAGDGDAAPYLQQAASAGIADRVRYVGWLDMPDVSALLLDADVLVLPSRSENLPVAVIEALAHGVAVVTTPVGATPEIVTDEVSALMVPVQDPSALANALARLAANPGLRQQISTAGLAAFRAKLEINAAARTLAGIYTNIIAAHP